MLCRIEKRDDGKFNVYYETEGEKEKTIVAAVVMFGTGRAPNTKNIGLEVTALRDCRLCCSPCDGHELAAV